MVDITPGDSGANKGFWRQQLRDKYGKFVEMGGSVMFDVQIPGTSGTSVGIGKFIGMLDLVTARIKVEDNSKVPKGVYFVKSENITAIQAVLPQEYVDEKLAENKTLAKSMSGSDALKERLRSVARALKEEGRFPIPRQAFLTSVGKDSDTAKGAKRDYQKVFDSEPSLQKKFGSAENLWQKVVEYAADDRTQSPNTLAEIPEDMKEINRAYAKHVLGLDPDGLITVYRNAINGKETPEESAIGYASLDRNMAYDYNPNRPNVFANGRYEIDVKPDEIFGMLGYSKVEDEYGITIGREMTNIPGRVRRVGDLKSPELAPWLEEGANQYRANQGGSPFRGFNVMGEYDFHPVEPLGESIDEFFSKYNLSAADIKTKFDQLFGEGAYDKYKASGNSVSYQRIRDLFVKLPDGRIGLDAVKLEKLNATKVNTSEYKDDIFDNTLKMLSVFQELTGQYFMTHKTRNYTPITEGDEDGRAGEPGQQPSAGPEGQGTVPEGVGPEGGRDDRPADSDGDSPWSSIGEPLAQSGRVKELADLGKNTPQIYELDPQKDAPMFRAAMQKLKENNPFAASVYIYEEDEYRQMRLFSTADGEAGFALKGGNEIVSVYVYSDSQHKGSARSLIAHAVELGGDRLDAFDTTLPGIYAKEGFRPISRVKWNDDYAPDGWDKQLYQEFNNGSPDVVVMAYDPERVGSEYNAKEGEYYEDYDAALEARDKWLEWRKNNSAESAEQTAESILPSRPGEAPIPEGHIRLYHYTLPEFIDKIKTEGIKPVKEGPSAGVKEPALVWATENEPAGGKQQFRNRPVVEFHVPEEVWDKGAGFDYKRTAMADAISPENIIAVHEPWHFYARDILDNNTPEDIVEIYDGVPESDNKALNKGKNAALKIAKDVLAKKQSK